MFVIRGLQLLNLPSTLADLLLEELPHAQPYRIKE